MELMQFAIEQAIATMWNRQEEPLSMAEIADPALMNKYYFGQAFRSMTGISPGRFLSAIRMFTAKQLLLQTSLSVTHIPCLVGYNSLSTFTNRFGRSVGDSPGRYRATSLAGRHCLSAVLSAAPGPEEWPGEVSGSVTFPGSAGSASVQTYVGIFHDPTFEGLPVACDVVDGSGTYTLRSVPFGDWYVRAAAVDPYPPDARALPRHPRFFGAGGKVAVRADSCVVKQDIGLHQACLLDPPILTCLPELDNFSAIC